MPRFFIDTAPEKTAVITGEDAMHIMRSLRMRVGEEIILCDQQGFDYRCEIASFAEKTVVANVLTRYASCSEPKIKVTLYQAMPKSDKMETIIQKSVELGVYRIVPVITTRCISRPEKNARKVDRYRKIALEAAKQSGRGIVPQVEEILSFSQALQQISTAPFRILFYEEDKTPFKQVLAQFPKEYTEISIFIGAEGGFAPQEVAALVEQGAHLASLGSRILRCETAPIAAIAAIMYHFDEFQR